MIRRQQTLSNAGGGYLQNGHNDRLLSTEVEAKLPIDHDRRCLVHRLSFGSSFEEYYIAGAELSASTC